MTAITKVPLKKIAPGNNDRTRFKESELLSLADSLNEHGLIQPITVRPKGKNFEIVAGERRFRAAQLAGWKEIDAIIRQLEDEPASAVMLAENTGRVDLNPIEEAKAYQKRIDAGWETERISKVAGVSEDLVKRRVSLLSLIPTIQMLLEVGEYPIGHAELMVRLDEERQQIAHRVFLRSQRGLSRQAFKDIVDQLQAEQDQGALFELEEFFLTAVEPKAPKRGIGAVTGAPTLPGLPAVTLQPKDTTASVLDRYIAELLAAGHKTEAAAIGTVYDALVRGNFLSVPPSSFLLTTGGNK